MKQSLFKDALEKIVALIFFCLFVTISVQVALRFLFNISLVWTWELANWLLIWGVYLGIIVAEINDAHIKADFLVKKYPPKIRHLVSIISDVLTVLLLIGTLVGLFKMMKHAYTIIAASAPVRMTYLYLPAAIGIIFSLAVMVIRRLKAPGLGQEQEL